MDVLTEIKESFSRGSSLTRLIYLNLGIFLVVGLVRTALFIFTAADTDFFIRYLSVPANLKTLLYHPWSLISYMFFHQDFLHILFNMLWLYWFGQLFLRVFSQRQLLGVYLLGGIGGAVMFIVLYNVLPVFKPVVPNAFALGASASILAVVIAVAVARPNFTIYLLFLGPVRLKYLALFTVLLDVITIPLGNPGGHIAHMGGALTGYLFVRGLSAGIDPTRYLAFLDRLAMPALFRRKKMRVQYGNRPESDYRYNARKAAQRKEVDRILDKIARSGYDSLSKDEKETLFRMK